MSKIKKIRKTESTIVIALTDDKRNLAIDTGRLFTLKSSLILN
jgi:hypothetical protein